MKKLTLLFSFLFFIVTSQHSFALTFNKIVFFGDSLSDNGNFYSGDWGYIPKSPPYFKGRFSNGPVWTENVANYFEKEGVQSVNFALAGETAIFHNPVKGYLPYSLAASVDSYLVHTFWQDRSQTLFILWVGANDYLPGVAVIDAFTSDVVRNIKYAVEQLIYHGGRYFLVLNLPDVGKTPYGKRDLAENLNALVTMHNAKLNTIIAELQAENKGAFIRMYDTHAVFDDLLAHPDNFNKKYHMKLRNVTEACWHGGYLLNQSHPQAEQAVIQQITEQLQFQQGLHGMNQADKPFSVPGFAQYIATTPALREAYRVALMAQFYPSCDDPDSYIFWDELHPSQNVHKILSILTIEEIKRYYS